MTIQEMFSMAGIVLEKNWLIIIILLSLIQIAPIKINPWTWVGSWIGKIIGVKEIHNKVEELDNKIDGLEDKVDKNQAITNRVRILRFGDELSRGADHSKESFDQVLDDITQYERYCVDHPKFENNKTVLTTKVIKETYHRLYVEHKI